MNNCGFIRFTFKEVEDNHIFVEWYDVNGKTIVKGKSASLRAFNSMLLILQHETKAISQVGGDKAFSMSFNLDEYTESRMYEFLEFDFQY